MNLFDREYDRILRDTVENGTAKKTRSGDVISVFGRQVRFDLKRGIPLITTKKMFTRGVLHELLWFIQHPSNLNGGMNMKYLLQNNVHIWDKDAYRWFRTWVENHVPKRNGVETVNYYVVGGDERDPKRNTLTYWIENEERKKDNSWLLSLTMDEFLDLCLADIMIVVEEAVTGFVAKYKFGDLGPIYGKQWRQWGEHNHIDQLGDIIKTLKEDPNDRRMICLAYNPSCLSTVALPPCHVMMQFYTRELTKHERTGIAGVQLSTPTDILDGMNIPKYGLSCMWTQRSVDEALGLPFNIFSYATLTYMIAKITNMVPDTLVGSLGDCHIYKNHIDGVMEQLDRNGSDEYPRLVILGEHESLDDFTIDDFVIENYNPDPAIKFELSVGQ